MSDCTLACRICGSVYDLPAGENHRPCPACGTENCRPQMEADVGDTLRRATAQRLRCDFKHAEDSYQYILKTSPDEHEALWGLVQCRYAIEYVKDPRSGKSMPIVHAVQKRPMLTDPDFREACDLAPEAIRAQYRQEAEYIDGAMARIRELAATGDAYDVFLCHKTSRTDGVEGYTEDYNRAVQLYIMLREMGYKVFFAPFAGLTPGDNYEAGIYHALCTSKVMLVVCSNQEYINSPWVRTEWQRFLEMSYEPGADKHLIPLLYGDLSPRRLPDDFRQLQAITMGELNAKDLLVAAIRKHVGETETARQAVESKPAPKEEPKPVQLPKPAQPTHAYAPESHFTTVAAEGGVAITGYTGPGGEVLIPPTIGEMRVVEIGKEAFKEQEKLTKVVIPEGVTSIRVCAFYRCSRLTSVSIPESVTSIGGGTFEGCSSLTSVSIPASVTSIRGGAFRNCSRLTSVSIPESVTSIGAWTFLGCSNLTLRVYPNTPAHTYAQQNNLRFELMIAYSPESHFTTAAAEGGVAITGYTGPGGEVLIPPTIGGMRVVEIGKEAFKEQEKLTKVVIPEGVTSIGDSAFCWCKSLTSVTIPEGVTSIGGSAFYWCESLTSVSIPASVTSIGEGAFYGCSGLTSVSIPASVTSIGEGAFHDCSSLTSVSIPASVTSIGGGAFQGCSSLTSVSIPESVTNLVSNPFEDCQALTSIAVAAGNEKYYVRDGVLMSRDNLLVCYPAGLTAGNYTIPASVTSIGGGAFRNCSSLTSVSIPESVTSIGDRAFWDCSSLTSVSIPAGVTSIGDGAFSGCSSLTSVSIPASVTSIGANAFCGCSGLTSVSIPASVTSIGDVAFCGCSGLTSVSIPETVTSIGAVAFCGCSGLTSVSIPESVTSIGGSAFRDCSRLTSVSIPETVTGIGNWAFLGCSGLASVSIPASVTSIGDWAFDGCSSLTLRVHPNTPAHTYAQQNNLRFELIAPAPQPVQKSLPPEPVQFRNEPAPKPTQKPSLFSRLFGKK